MKKFLKLTQTETADVQIAEAAMVTLGLLPDAIAHMKENKNMANAMKTLRLVEHSVVQSAKLVNMKSSHPASYSNKFKQRFSSHRPSRPLLYSLNSDLLHRHLGPRLPFAPFYFSVSHSLLPSF